MRQQDLQESDFQRSFRNSGLNSISTYSAGCSHQNFLACLKASLLAEASIECAHAHRGVPRDGLQSKHLVQPLFEPSKERLKRASVWGRRRVYDKLRLTSVALKGRCITATRAAGGEEHATGTD